MHNRFAHVLPKLFLFTYSYAEIVGSSSGIAAQGWR